MMHLPTKLERSPDKEGIETAPSHVLLPAAMLERSPDKEGIETGYIRERTPARR